MRTGEVPAVGGYEEMKEGIKSKEGMRTDGGMSKGRKREGATRTQHNRVEAGREIK